jgi:glucose/arabinose dehydrogenase
LLSIVVHPDYPADRRMFAWYTGNSGDTHLVEFDIAADLQSASSPRTVLTVDQPFSNHNGGYLSFGDDGYLYLGIGDGGSGNDPGNRARNLGTLLASTSMEQRPTTSRRTIPMSASPAATRSGLPVSATRGAGPSTTASCSSVTSARAPVRRSTWSR